MNVSQPQAPSAEWIHQEKVRAAALRGYTWAGVVTLILYFVMWLPGLIANLVFLSQARRDQQLTGVAPVGTVFLKVLLWVCGIVIPTLSVVALVIAGIALTHAGPVSY